MHSADESFMKYVLEYGINDPLFIVKVNNQNVFEYDFLNDATQKQMNLSKDIEGSTFHDVWPKSLADDLLNQHREASEKKISLTYESFEEYEEEIIYWRTILTPLYCADQCYYIVAVVKDISAEKQNDIETSHLRYKIREKQRKSEESEEQLRIIAENTSDLIMVINQDGYITYTSASYRMMLGYDPEEYIGNYFLYNIYPEDQDNLSESFYFAVEMKREWYEQFRQADKQGNYIWFELLGTPVYDEYGMFTHMVVVTRNISVQKNYENKLHYMAYHDPLTGLPNRRYFMEKLYETLERMEKQNLRLALIMLDLDQFKLINDQLGHHIGDQVIQEFAVHVRKAIRRDDVLSRHGGDEFLLMLPDIKETNDVIKVVDRIHQSVDEPWYIEGYEITISCSVGVIISSPYQPESLNHLLRQVDSELYKAKVSAENNYQLHDCLFD